jgi:hypothetical protein
MALIAEGQASGEVVAGDPARVATVAWASLQGLAAMANNGLLGDARSTSSSPRRSSACSTGCGRGRRRGPSRWPRTSARPRVRRGHLGAVAVRPGPGGRPPVGQSRGVHRSKPISSRMRRPSKSLLRSVLVGRDSERARLQALLDGLREERSFALVVHGDAGIGKTTLVAAVVDEAEASGLRVLRLRAYEGEADLAWAGLWGVAGPFLALVDRLRRSSRVRCAPRWRSTRRPPSRRRPTASRSRWRCSGCWRRRPPRTARCSSSSTTPTGWTAPRATRCSSSRGGSVARASAC